MKLDKSLAFQVVNTIKDTCGQDINFIDKQGMIFASSKVATPTGLVRFMPSVTKPPRQNRQSKFFQMMIFPEHKKESICHSIITAVFLQ